MEFSHFHHMYAPRTLEPYGGATQSWGEGCRLEDIYIYIYIYIYTKASIRIMLKLRGSTFLHSYIAAITMSS